MAVYYHSNNGRWIVRVRRGGLLTQVKSFTDELEARAYDATIDQDDNTFKQYTRGWYEQESKKQLKDLPRRYARRRDEASY